MNIKDITNIFNNCHFKKISLTEDNFESDIIPYINLNNFEYRYGATKMVIIPSNLPFVIKIPFTGLCEYNKFRLFSHGGGKEKWNYCELENELYNHIKKNHFEHVFLNNVKIGEKEGIPIYIQRKIDYTIREFNKKSKMTDEEIAEEGERISDSLKSNRYYYIGTQSLWFKSLIKKYGIKYTESFLKFIRDDFHISDLHNENLGFINGDPVIIDYAGFED